LLENKINEYKNSGKISDDLIVEISSFGGDVITALKMYNHIKLNKIFQTRGGKQVDSAAIIPFLVGDYHTCYTNTNFYFHLLQPYDQNLDRLSASQQVVEFLDGHSNLKQNEV
jgi:ATP-dependent protease ClpP protease subunit